MAGWSFAQALALARAYIETCRPISTTASGGNLK
jgi:hypothetical protein